MKLIITILMLALATFAQSNKMITRSFTWESGSTCEISVDTSKVHRYTVKTKEGSTYYQYPIKIQCLGFTTTKHYTYTVSILDDNGFVVGSYWFYAYNGENPYSRGLEVFCDNPLRIYDASSMQIK